MSEVLLLQPRHVYAPPEEIGHVCLPGSLLTFQAQLLAAGARIAFADENLRPAETDRFATVGLNVVGAPYLPAVRERLARLNASQNRLVGGAVIRGLTRPELTQLFGAETAGELEIQRVAAACEIDASDLPPPHETSLVPAYEQITDADMQLYLGKEIALYAAQGCRFRCTFCAADKNRDEKYRSAAVLQQDLAYLTVRAQRLGISQLNFYLSNLDLFQSPEALGTLAHIFLDLKKANPNFNYQFRGLATAAMFVHTAEKFPQVLADLCAAGLTTVGFGVDGADESIWQSVGKSQNKLPTILRALEICRDYGITPENLMVFGGSGETRHTIENEVLLSQRLADEYGALQRPHVAKTVPGSDEWRSPSFSPTRELLLRHPEYLQALDFQALASAVSHPYDAGLRALINEAYLAITALGGVADSVIFPISPEYAPERNVLHARLNSGKYDR